MKKIGIVSHPVGPNSFGITTPYLEWLDLFGEVKILDYGGSFDPSIDLLVLPGGPDVDSMRYGEKPHRRTTKPCQYREYFDEVVLPQYIANGTPTFGVCRGLQTLAVFFGGALHQHVMHPTSIKDRAELVHGIHFKIKDGYNIIDYKEEVNSLHHQTVSLMPAELRVIGRYHDAKKGKGFKGPVEAIIHKTLPIAGIQYHAEELLYDKLANTLVEDLLEGIDNDKYLEV